MKYESMNKLCIKILKNVNFLCVHNICEEMNVHKKCEY